MDDFIVFLEQKFNIDLIKADHRIPWKNTFKTDDDGNIKSLFLYGLELKQIDLLIPIAESLSELWLQDCQIDNIDSLEIFKNLTKLCLDSNPISASSFNQVSQLKNLKELRLEETNINDTLPFRSLVKLERLYLGYCSDLKNIQGLERLIALRHLDLEFSEIENIENIELNQRINSLNLRNSGIQRLSGLERYTNLYELDLPGNPIKKLEGLDNLTNLRRLVVSSAILEKIEGLDHLINLEVLDLSNNIYGKLNKISGLDSLINLKQLNLNENLITKVEGLDNLKNLEYLLLECNQIDKVETSFMNNLNTCFISLVGNPIKKIDEPIPQGITIKFEDENWMPKGL